jgi:hypothetical protein
VHAASFWDFNDMAVGFRLTEIKCFTNCTEDENGVGEEMIHLFGGNHEHVLLCRNEFKLTQFVIKRPTFQIINTEACDLQVISCCLPSMAKIHRTIFLQD